MPSQEQVSLYDGSGARKYLCGKEVLRFLDAAAERSRATDTFCRLMAYTGCRLSEALAVCPTHLDPETGRVVFQTLKRRQVCFRAVPIPPRLMAALLLLGRTSQPTERLWPWCRQTAWRRVQAVMASAGIVGPQANPKGLRHGFGIANAESSIPMPLTQKWLGHATLETTAIYQQAVGREEREFARRLWRALRAR